MLLFNSWKHFEKENENNDSDIINKNNKGLTIDCAMLKHSYTKLFVIIIVKKKLKFLTMIKQIYTTIKIPIIHNVKKYD